MGMRKQAIVWAAVLAMLVSGPGGTASETSDQKILTTGIHPITDKNTPRAREKAVADALEQAVAHAFVQVVSPRVFAANLEFLHTRILPAAETYITTFRVLGEATHKNDYLVGVESRVHSGLLAQTLAKAGILNGDADRPRILLLIAEQTASDLLPKYWWGNHPDPYHSHAEIQIADRMTQNRFKVVESGGERPDPMAYDIQFKSIYDTRAAVDLARELNADLVVLGRVGATESSNRMGDEQIFEADIHLDALDVTTGESVARCEHQVAAKTDADRPGDIQAIVRAAEAAAADLSTRIDKVWSQKQRKETSFDVYIQGDRFLPRFIALKKGFAEIREIENVQPREIGSDQAVLEMVYKGRPEQFAHRIMLKTFDGFGVEIVELTDSRVTIRFIDDTSIRDIDDSVPFGADNEKTPE